jgi:hypothetical protein
LLVAKVLPINNLIKLALFYNESASLIVYKPLSLLEIHFSAKIAPSAKIFLSKLL